MVKSHLCDFRAHAVFNGSHWLAIPCVPNFYGFLTCDVDFKPYVTKNRYRDWIVVGNVWRKRFTKLKYFEASSADD
jgi:hypothetical protein